MWLVCGRGSLVEIYERLISFCPATPSYRDIIAVLTIMTELKRCRGKLVCDANAPMVTVVNYENSILMDFCLLLVQCRHVTSP